MQFLIIYMPGQVFSDNDHELKFEKIFPVGLGQRRTGKQCQKIYDINRIT
jgi:hypothetical protein